MSMTFFILEPDLGPIIAGGILGKFILGIGYSPFLVLFLLIFRQDLEQFIKEPFNVRYIIIPPKECLMEELEKVEKDLVK